MQNELNETIKYYKERQEDDREVKLSEDLSSEKTEIIMELTKIKSKIDEDSNANNVLDLTQLVAFLTIENRSSLPNTIKGRALFVVYNERGVILNIPLKLNLSHADEENSSDLENNDGRRNTTYEKPILFRTLPGNDTLTIELISEQLYNVQPGTGDKMARAADLEYEYLILIQDMDGRIWSTDGERLSNLNVDQDLKALQNEAETQIRKKN